MNPPNYNHTEKQCTSFVCVRVCEGWLPAQASHAGHVAPYAPREAIS